MEHEQAPHERIQEVLRERFKGDRKAFAAAAQATEAAVCKWVHGPTVIGEDKATRLQESTGYSAAWLRHGRLPRRIDAGTDARLVPLISWVSAGAWREAYSPESMADTWLTCPLASCEGIYALKVRGDSMTRPFGMSYPDGCTVFVDARRRWPFNGQHVIALLEGGTEATFKAFRDEDGRRWLQPLNPTHPPVTQPFEVIGTVLLKQELAP